MLLWLIISLTLNGNNFTSHQGRVTTPGKQAFLNKKSKVTYELPVPSSPRASIIIELDNTHKSRVKLDIRGESIEFTTSMCTLTVATTDSLLMITIENKGKKPILVRRIHYFPGDINLIPIFGKQALEVGGVYLKGDTVVAEGIGYPPSDAEPSSQRSLAIRAAKTEALRKLQIASGIPKDKLLQISAIDIEYLEGGAIKAILKVLKQEMQTSEGSTQQ